MHTLHNCKRRTLFDLNIKDVSQCVMPGVKKSNDVELQFHESDATDQTEVNVDKCGCVPQYRLLSSRVQSEEKTRPRQIAWCDTNVGGAKSEEVVIDAGVQERCEW